MAHLYITQHHAQPPAAVQVEVVRRDDGGPNPQITKRPAQEPVTRGHVQFLTGVVWTPNAGAIAPLATEAKIPFVLLNASGRP